MNPTVKAMSAMANMGAQSFSPSFWGRMSASLLRASRQSVNEAVGELKAAGLITTGYRRIDILDPAGLRLVAERS
jgi:hypothetical protein